LIALIINVHTLGRMHAAQLPRGAMRPDIDKKDQLAS